MTKNPIPTDQFTPTVVSKRRWKGVLRLAIMTVAVAMIAWYVTSRWGDFLIVKNLSLAVLVCVVLIDIQIYVYGAVTIRVVVRAFDVKTSMWEAWLMAVATRFGNILMPFRGGAFARALYLNKAHRLSYPHFLAGLSAMLLATVTVSIVCALGGLVYLYAATGLSVLSVSLVLAAALAAICLMVIFRPKMDERGSALRRQLARLVNGWDLMCRNRGSIAALLTMNLLHILTMTVIYGLLLADIDQPIRLGLLIVIISLGNLSMIFQITPGNIGVYEGTVAIISSLAGLSATSILAVTLTWRVMDALLVLSIGPFCSHALTNRAVSARR